MDEQQESPESANESPPDLWAKDAWDRDDWKNEDWGVPPADAQPAKPSDKRGGIASYRAGMMEAGPHLTLGLQIAGGMLFFVGLGYLIDSRLETSPWGLVCGACFGMIGVFSLVVRMAREADETRKR